jgi:ABC-2 type transport system ATP-binding protein
LKVFYGLKVPVVELRGVTKRFGRVVALNDLSLVINGRVNGLIGPNGAGKTTLLNILLGFTRADVGEAYVLGFDVRRELLEIKKRVGVLPENPGFPSSFTGEEFLVRVARLRGVSEPRKRGMEVLKVVGLGGAADRRIRTYSAGMYQRLGLAQAIIGDPELVVLDEPAANLDPLGRMDVLRLIDSYSRERGVRFLLSTHILYDVEKTCDWVGVMDSGRVMVEGSVEELIQKYSGLAYSIVVSDLKVFGAALAKTDLVKSVAFKEDAVVATFKADVDVYGEVMRLAKRVKVKVEEVRPVLGSLDEVFRRVVSPD